MKIFNRYTILAIVTCNFVSSSPVPNISGIAEDSLNSSSLIGSSNVTATDFTAQQSKITTIPSSLKPLNGTKDCNNTTLPNLNVMLSTTSKRAKTSDFSTNQNATAVNINTHHARAYNEPLTTYGVVSSKSEPYSSLTETSKNLRVPHPLSTNNSATSLPNASRFNTTNSRNTTATSHLFSGNGTYYSPGLGACGDTNSDSDYIVAVSQQLYDTMKQVCGKKIEAFYGNKSVIVDVVDSCEDCNYYDLDFSPAAFAKLADEKLGRIHISWKWE